MTDTNVNKSIDLTPANYINIWILSKKNLVLEVQTLEQYMNTLFQKLTLILELTLILANM